MCILFIAVKQHPDFPLIIAANRDEFHERPTAASQFWQDHRDILAGRDLRAQGTWMGINKNGRLSALTNVRDPQKLLENPISRGELVSRFLTDTMPAKNYLASLKASKDKYNGYNLLFGEWDNLAVYNNHTDQVQYLEQGVFGLSNADLNSPWPKINHGVAQLKAHCQQPDPINTETLFNILLDQSQSADELLPQTGVSIEWERKLSSIFIQSKEYGTRSSTLLLVDQHKQVQWHEHIFDYNGVNRQQRDYRFQLS